MASTETPTLFIIWHQPGKGHKWLKAGRTSSYAEALTMIGGSGDWHIAPLKDERLAGELTRVVNTEMPRHKRETP